MGFRASYVADTVWAVADTLTPNLSTFPVLFNMQDFKSTPQYYMGLIDGSTPFGNIIHTGLEYPAPSAKGAPKVAADPDRRSLLRTEWVQEFFKTSSGPVGHGFNLVAKTARQDLPATAFYPEPMCS